MEVQSYRDLLVWQKAMDLVVICYRLAEKLPASESFGLGTDIKRQARLVPSYIADGKGRKLLAEYISKLSPAHGSLMALETDLLLTERLGFLTMTDIEPALDLSSQVGKMLNKLITKLRGTGADT
jgi:four helix bundle protein